ncbi:MAG TPA: hypothetical protein DCQ28_04360, partial [Bacteroidetes bacterium]|nr:hypothetical protein [Bacteroidota bacterium]
MGTNYFSLAAGETKRIVSVLAYGNTKEEIFQAINFGRIFVNAGFDVQKMNNAISIQSVLELPGSKTIQWQTGKPGGTIDVYFSSDNGITFSRVAENEGNDGSFNWNTTLVADCYFGRLMVIAKDGSGNPIGFNVSERFSIDNAMNGSPFLNIVSDTFATTVFIDKPMLSVLVLIGDPDNATLTLKTSYSIGGGFTLYSNQSVQTGSIPQEIKIDLVNAPNSNTLSLKFELSDGVNTVSATTFSFKKQVVRTTLSASNVQFISKNTSASVQINVRDASATTNDSYQISFCDTADYGKKKTYSVKNMTKGSMIAENLPLISETETDLFGGLSLFVTDVKTALSNFIWSNTSKVKNQITITPLIISLDLNPANDLHPYSHPSDYSIVFYDHIVDTSVTYYGSAAIPLKFKTMNTSTGKPVKVIADLSYGMNLLFFEQVMGTERYTWYVTFETKNDSLPQPGDTLSIVMKKGVSLYDTLLVKNIALSVGGDPEFIPRQYSLSQNYPNPF